MSWKLRLSFFRRFSRQHQSVRCNWFYDATKRTFRFFQSVERATRKQRTMWLVSIIIRLNWLLFFVLFYFVWNTEKNVTSREKRLKINRQLELVGMRKVDVTALSTNVIIIDVVVLLDVDVDVELADDVVVNFDSNWRKSKSMKWAENQPCKCNLVSTWNVN